MPGNVPPVRDEREGLLAYLDHGRDGVRLAAYGLSDAQARATPSPSALSVGGVVKHLASVERFWMDVVLDRVGEAGSFEEYQATFHLTGDETVAMVLDDYGQAAAETAKVVDSIADLGRPVPVPSGVPWFSHDVEAWSLRWVLLHLIEETARHGGHADVVREAIDGASAMALMAAAEKWPSSPWLTPWEPKS